MPSRAGSHTPVSNFHETVEATFPGAMPAAEYLSRVGAAMTDLGFDRDRTLPLVSICRDELTTPFFDQIESEWGNAFQLAGLGGIPALGWTGWQAALGHIPDATGRGAVVVFGFPHIGIEDDGSIGVTIRPGQTQPTATCGALTAICQRAASGDLPTEVDVEDYEATNLAMRLVDPSGPPPELVGLTVAALDALEEDVWFALDRFEVWRDHDLIAWCGVQIHGHGQDWIWPRDAWLCSPQGERRRIPPAG